MQKQAALTSQKLYLTAPQVDQLMVILDLLERNSCKDMDLISSLVTEIEERFVQDYTQSVKQYQLNLNEKCLLILKDLVEHVYKNNVGTPDELVIVKEFYFLLFLHLYSASDAVN